MQPTSLVIQRYQLSQKVARKCFSNEENGFSQKLITIPHANYCSHMQNRSCKPNLFIITKPYNFEPGCELDRINLCLSQKTNYN